ncbi:MAG: glutamate 5-kinase [Gammaproteobacteria bacterium]|nr:glutamate 5-kinase [Gammaproteobacteria bacterium]MYJ52355.1 glutamate 5-kinase [Gammaproteobacteria bacterium]
MKHEAETADRSVLTHSTRWVIKVGTSLLTDFGAGLRREVVESLVHQICRLLDEGMQVVLVSSGSIGEGMRRLGWERRPDKVHRVQAAAAIGQIGLVHSYEAAFSQHGVHSAQILLTHADLASRERYLNARHTIRELLGLKVVPIVNENDAVVNEEIRFGDNDTLAALAANLIEAECLILLTDQLGLFDSNPRHSDRARLIRYGKADDASLLDLAGEAGAHGRGGMVTKVLAAEKASRSGSCTVIASGQEEDVLLRLRAGEEMGTLLSPGRGRIAARKQWLAGQLRSNGRLVLDNGAVNVLRKAGKSLLPVGVTAVEGDFTRGEIVTCVDSQGLEIARGLVNYNSDETRKIIGQPSRSIEQILGYSGESELIHRDNIAVTA